MATVAKTNMSLLRRVAAKSARAPGAVPAARVRTFVCSALRVPPVRPGVVPLAPRAFERHLHARAMSTHSGMPKFMLRFLRVPVAGIATAGGLYAYTHYKVSGMWDKRMRG